MNKSYSKIRHIQEANKSLEKRVLSEKDMSDFFKNAIKESFLPIIQEGDDLCDILCYRKQAKFGSNGDVVKLIQNALVNCGHNAEKQGGGMVQGCKDDHTKCDGKFREETKKATEEFQRATGLTVDGAVGFETLKKLGEKCIKLPDCKCGEEKKNEKTSTNNEWWKLIGKDDYKFGDCEKINSCMYEVLKSTKLDFNWDMFLSCMSNKIGGKKSNLNDCGKCPDTFDKMPKRGYDKGTDMKFIESCISKGCTKPVY